MTASFNKIPESKCLIRFPDCDPFNHLNNSKYLDYFLNAREDHLMEFYNFNLYNHTKETGCGWVVAQHEIAYLKPAFTTETVLIQSQILRWGDKDILAEFKMWDEKKIKLKSVMWSKFFYFNFQTSKSEFHPTELTEQFKKLESPVEGMESFDSRVSLLKNL